MAEGLKMFYARHEQKNKKIIHISEIKPIDRDFLLCQFCDAKITWVDSYQRMGRTIPSYLRLWPKAMHGAECKNRVKSAVDALVAQSKNVEDDKSIFLDNNTGYIFRMNILTDASFDVHRARTEYNDATDSNDKKRKIIQYISSEKKLADYFNSAAGIAKIRAKIEDSADRRGLSELIKIALHKKNISWNNFFYDEDRYPVLFKNADKINHPVAIALTVKSIKNIKANFISLKGEECHVETSNHLKDYFSPEINTNIEAVFEGIHLGDELIVVGWIKTSVREWNNITYKNITFRLSHKKQFSKINE
ncbi:hypothetical protein HC231_21575 [Brenneria izadpanahii]|uniref:Uncharacterized protein n=1 Tax=Brenneria izadpanahii TaxID=2722756 RepID=A0ABX7UWP3_9GAMM|nr:hypothetical protein [Brenneria izadpanahii]QTF10228.1 hypothetical protein HC231_21575 [Brenneria izadpanahii]